MKAKTLMSTLYEQAVQNHLTVARDRSNPPTYIGEVRTICVVDVSMLLLVTDTRPVLNWTTDIHALASNLQQFI